MLYRQFKLYMLLFPYKESEYPHDNIARACVCTYVRVCLCVCVSFGELWF